MNPELAKNYQMLREAVYPEDVFFGLTAEDEEGKLDQLHNRFRYLSRSVHPDLYNDDPEEKEMAVEAFKVLNEMYERAIKRVKNNTYGSRASGRGTHGGLLIKTAKREYVIERILAEGDLSTIYAGKCVDAEMESGEVVIKLIRDPADNDLAQNELRVLKIFQDNPGKQSKHLPVFLDQFRTEEDKIGIVLRQFDGYDLMAVREKYPRGIPQKHVVWMLNRALSAIGHPHSLGITHNNIEPAHMMIRPRDHNLFFLDWSYAAVNPAQTGEGFRVFNPDFSAPEVRERKPPIPASDLYSIGKCMIYLLGGNLETNAIPGEVDERLVRFLQFFVRESPLQRPQDAWETHAQLIELIETMWGPRKFLEFVM